MSEPPTGGGCTLLPGQVSSPKTSCCGNLNQSVLSGLAGGWEEEGKGKK